ncbi:uroporphyrinogen-III synthase [Terracidiphilus sp.]|jgi:uroporphyrinogen-III synthase|uniref:uroporphyrinogen-III synthase n=1 Tax=Terracidiphilus sp. TaxID=1964191 RepID=UPI003C209C7E
MTALSGRRILVTRAAHQASKLSEGLRTLGAEPVEVPVLEIRPPGSFAALDSALHDIASYDWLIFTSTNTVHALIERATTVGAPSISQSHREMDGIAALSISPHTRIAAIGSSTAAALQNAGLQVDFVPTSYVAESLIKGLASYWPGQRVLLARASQARDVIPDALRTAGAQVDVVDAYRNVMPTDAPEKLRSALAKKLDAATFTSSSSVTHLAEAAAKAGIPFPLDGIAAISIGPITSQTLCEHNWPPAAEANPSDIPGLIAAVKRFFERNC